MQGRIRVRALDFQPASKQAAGIPKLPTWGKRSIDQHVKYNLTFKMITYTVSILWDDI